MSICICAYVASMTYVRLGCTELELDETDLGFLYPRRAADGRDDVLVENDAIYELCVLDCAANLLHYSDVTEVDI